MTLYEILNYKVLTATIQTVKNGIPFGLPQAFLVSRTKTEGNKVDYLAVEGTRETAKMIAYGSPSKMRELKGVKEKTATLIHTKEHQQFKPVVMQNLIDTNGTKQMLGRSTVTEQTVIFAKLFENLRYAAIYHALCNGVIYFDKDGNLLNSSAGAFYTVSFDIPAAHKSQLNVFGAGNIISAKWSVAGTKINAQVKAIREAALRKTGYPLKYALYGKNIPDYLLANTALSKAIEGNPAYQQAFVEGKVPANFLELTWIPASDGAFYVDSTGTIRDIWPDDRVVFCPEPDMDWYDMVEGSDIVPATFGKVSADAAAALGDATQVFGKYSYAVLQDDPVTIKQIAGDTFLPLIKNNWAIFQADVHW